MIVDVSSQNKIQLAPPVSPLQNFNRKKIRKFFEHERDRVRDSRPLSPQAASRMEAIKLRHGTPRHFRQQLRSTPSTVVAQVAFAAAAVAAAAAASADARNVSSNGSSSSTGQRPPSNRASSSSGSALAEASPWAAGRGATAGESGGGRGGGGLEAHFGVSGAVVNNTRRSSGGGGFGGDYPRGGLPERRFGVLLVVSRGACVRAALVMVPWSFGKLIK